MSKITKDLFVKEIFDNIESSCTVINPGNHLPYYLIDDLAYHCMCRTDFKEKEGDAFSVKCIFYMRYLPGFSNINDIEFGLNHLVTEFILWDVKLKKPIKQIACHAKDLPLLVQLLGSAYLVEFLKHKKDIVQEYLEIGVLMSLTEKVDKKEKYRLVDSDTQEEVSTEKGTEIKLFNGDGYALVKAYAPDECDKDAGMLELLDAEVNERFWIDPSMCNLEWKEI